MHRAMHRSGVFVFFVASLACALAVGRPPAIRLPVQAVGTGDPVRIAHAPMGLSDLPSSEARDDAIRYRAYLSSLQRLQPTIAPYDAPDGLGGFDELVRYVTASPNQEDAGTPAPNLLPFPRAAPSLALDLSR